MSRFFYYLIAVNMLSNVVALVPRMMFDYLTKGAVSAIVIAIFVGVGFICSLMWCLAKFPQQDIADILKKTTPKMFSNTILFIFVVALWSAGCLTLYAFTDIITQFLSPDVNPVIISIFLMIIVIYIITLSTIKVLYFVELLLIIVVPFLVIVFLKAYGEQSLDWDQIGASMTYVVEMPSPMAMIAASYSLTGYINMIIYNSVFKKISVPKYWWAIGIVGLGNLLTSFFVPIGFHGMEGVGSIVYPWIATSDALRMEYGFIERVIFIFILSYIGIALTSVIIHWHGARILTEKLLDIEQKPERKQMKARGLILLAFFIFALTGEMQIDEELLLNYAKQWMVARFFIEILIIACLFYATRVRKK